MDLEEKNFENYMPQLLPISYMPFKQEMQREESRQLLKRIGRVSNLDLLSIFNQIIEEDNNAGFLDNSRELTFMSIIRRKIRTRKTFDLDQILQELDDYTKQLQCRITLDLFSR